MLNINFLLITIMYIRLRIFPAVIKTIGKLKLTFYIFVHFPGVQKMTFAQYLYNELTCKL